MLDTHLARTEYIYMYIYIYIYIYMSCTKYKIRVVVATHSTLVLLLPRCTRAPTKRHSSPVEAVLTGSGAALPGLIEIPKSPWGHGTID